MNFVRKVTLNVMSFDEELKVVHKLPNMLSQLTMHFVAYLKFQIFSSIFDQIFRL